MSIVKEENFDDVPIGYATKLIRIVLNFGLWFFHQFLSTFNGKNSPNITLSGHQNLVGTKFQLWESEPIVM